MTERGNPWTMLRLARLNAWLMMLILVAQSAAHTKTNDHCSCHSVKSRTFTRLMFERGFRAAAAHRASDLKLSPPRRHDLMIRAHLPCDRMIEVMREGHPRARPMNADDPFHPCRRGGPLANESWWSADHAAASEQLRQAEAGEAPLGGTARKHLGLS